MLIQLITTGGTLDKKYCPLSGHLTVDMPVIADILSQASISRLAITEVVRKDSLEMTQLDRDDIVNAVAASPLGRILITHGTDTMGETAQCLADADLGKTIVLTGAMIPHGFPGSDAAFNIGVAYGAAQHFPVGVYIAMHGQVLPHNSFLKNRAEGRFEPLSA